MFDKLKEMAMEQLKSKMASNSLGAKETAEAAEEGSNGIMEILQSQLASGGIDQVKDLFSGGNVENNGIFAAAKQKMAETLQAKGMNVEDARMEAANATPDLINSLKDRFQSNEAADSAFDLESLASLVPGGLGGLMDKAKGMLGN